MGHYATETIHATCVDVSGVGILIRGSSGSGKTTLALMLMDEARSREGEVKLVSDDRVIVDNDNGVLVASAPETIAGSIEVRGVGIIKVENVHETCIGLVVDLVEADNLERIPDDNERTVSIKGACLPRIKVLKNNPHAAMIVRHVLATNKQRIR